MIRRGLVAAFVLHLAVAATAAEPSPSPVPPKVSPTDAIDPIDRHTMQVHFLLGTELYKERNYQGAIDEWNEVLKIQPDHALAREKIRKAQARLKD